MSWDPQGFATRTRRARPSEKIALRVIPGPFPARPCVLGSPSPRRGGLRTPVTTAQRQLQRCPPLATGLSSTHPVGMECLGLRPALPPGRGDRVPPRKWPFALSPGFPREAIRPWLAHPSEGRAPHARENGNGFTPACLPWALGSSFIPGNHDTPRLASSLTTRTRRAHPSEKIALPIPFISCLLLHPGLPTRSLGKWPEPSTGVENVR